MSAYKVPTKVRTEIIERPAFGQTQWSRGSITAESPSRAQFLGKALVMAYVDHALAFSDNEETEACIATNSIGNCIF